MYPLKPNPQLLKNLALKNQASLAQTQAPKELSELQLQFKTQLFNNHADPKRIAHESELQWIRETPPVSAKKRIGIYSYAYSSRLIRVLEEDFPILSAHLGSEKFKSIAREYLATHPPSSELFTVLGENFADFLANTVKEERFHKLSELASLERALTRAFYAREQVREGLDHIAQATESEWNEARLELDPSVELITHSHQWSAFFDVEPSEALEGQWPGAVPEFLMVHRYEDEGVFEVLPEVRWNLLRRLQSGFTLAEACAGIDPMEFTPEIFSGWLNEGVIHSVRWGAGTRNGWGWV